MFATSVTTQTGGESTEIDRDMFSRQCEGDKFEVIQALQVWVITLYYSWLIL